MEEKSDLASPSLQQDHSAQNKMTSKSVATIFCSIYNSICKVKVKPNGTLRTTNKQCFHLKGSQELGLWFFVQKIFQKVGYKVSP
jgi:hypothetical protein